MTPSSFSPIDGFDDGMFMQLVRSIFARAFCKDTILENCTISTINHKFSTLEVLFPRRLTKQLSPQIPGMATMTAPVNEPNMVDLLLTSSLSCWFSKSLIIFFVLQSIDLSLLGRKVDVTGNADPSLNSTIRTQETYSSSSKDQQISVEPSRTLQKKTLFQYQPDALRNYPSIPFQEEWLNDFNMPPHDAMQDFGPNHTIVPSPKSLPVPDFLPVYKLNSSASLKEMGAQARRIIDENLATTGAILFRNLHTQIHNATQFATFWNHVVVNNNKRNWNPMTEHLSCYNRKRQKLGGLADGVDRVDTDVPSFTIGPHNEHSCNPRPADKIFFYVLYPAVQGGETLLRRNQDIVVPEPARQLIETAGGFQFIRSYPSQQQLLELSMEDRHPTEMSWQERTQTQHHAQAREYFATHHGIFNVTFDSQDTLTAHTILPGLLDDSKQTWFNRIDYGFPVQLADGTEFPLHWQSKLKRQKWHETSIFKLHQGDWLVLDNLQVQHGRLPYRDVKGHPARQLLVTYTSRPM